MDYCYEFIYLINGDGLINIFKSVFLIIKEVDKVLGIYTDNYTKWNKNDKLMKKIIIDSSQRFPLDNNIFKNLDWTNAWLEELPYKLFLILAVTKRYL